MLSVNSNQLANEFQADFGDRFWAMAQSGIQKEDLDANEISQRDALQKWLSETPQSLHQEEASSDLLPSYFLTHLEACA